MGIHDSSATPRGRPDDLLTGRVLLARRHSARGAGRPSRHYRLLDAVPRDAGRVIRYLEPAVGLNEAWAGAMPTFHNIQLPHVS